MDIRFIVLLALTVLIAFITLIILVINKRKPGTKIMRLGVCAIISFCMFIALTFIYSVGLVGVSASNIESDARKSQKVSAWEVSKSINDNLCAMIFYNDTLDKHTFSIYVNRDGFSFGYFFRAGGSNSVVSDGIHEFGFDIYGSAIISMNKDNVARIELDNDIEVTRIDIDPAKPFAVVIPINCGSVTLYDINGNIVSITASQEGL